MLVIQVLYIKYHNFIYLSSLYYLHKNCQTKTLEVQEFLVAIICVYFNFETITANVLSETCPVDGSFTDV